MMKTEKILSVILFCLGEVILIGGFFLLQADMLDEILFLDMAISTVVYTVLFFSFIRLWFPLRDSVQIQGVFGSIGVRWGAVWTYAVASVAFMVIATLYGYVFRVQLVVQGVLLFFLLSGIWMSGRAREKAEEVHRKETSLLYRMDALKEGVFELNEDVKAAKNIPSEFRRRVEELSEKIHYLSPCQGNNAGRLEEELASDIRRLRNCVTTYALSKDEASAILQRCESLYVSRKHLLN